MTEQTPEEWHTKGLLNKIKQLDQNNTDRAFAFILGAGASVNSQIPAGAELASKWLTSIYQEEVAESEMQTHPMETWAANRLNITDFKMADIAAHYATIFEACFAGDPPAGYAELEHVMAEAKPSLGYSVLAHILDKTRHRVVITTNFDNLVADALAMQALVPPLIVGHESLAEFVRPNPRRPLVAKIHRDLHLHPKNTTDEVNTLASGWQDALTRLLQNYTPIFIGYGGNDGSLMGFLEALDPTLIPGQPFWCYYEKDFPNDRIQQVMAKHRGVISPIAGFDEFMVQLAREISPELQLEDIAESIENIGKERAAVFTEQMKQLLENTAKAAQSSASETSKQASNAISMASKAVTSEHDQPKDWWVWQLRIDALETDEQRDALYQEALQSLPNAHRLLGNYALFLHEVRKDYDQVEQYYQRALEADPKHANNLGNYANFLMDVKKDHDQAEQYYQRALEIDPKHANILGNYALFLHRVRRDGEQAEQYYLQALEVDPNHGRHLGNYALFLYQIKQDYDQAEQYYQRALEADPKHATCLGNYALFLHQVRKDYDQAEQYYLRCFECDPDYVYHLNQYAYFLESIRQDYDKAEQFYQHALKVDPNYQPALNRYSTFLRVIRKDDQAAERIEEKRKPPKQ